MNMRVNSVNILVHNDRSWSPNVESAFNFVKRNNFIPFLLEKLGATQLVRKSSAVCGIHGSLPLKSSSDCDAI